MYVHASKRPTLHARFPEPFVLERHLELASRRFLGRNAHPPRALHSLSDPYPLQLWRGTAERRATSSYLTFCTYCIPVVPGMRRFCGNPLPNISGHLVFPSFEARKLITAWPSPLLPFTLLGYSPFPHKIILVLSTYSRGSVLIKSEARWEILILRTGLPACQAPTLGSPPHPSPKGKLLLRLVDTGCPNREMFSHLSVGAWQGIFLFYGRGVGECPALIFLSDPLSLALSAQDGWCVQSEGVQCSTDQFKHRPWKLALWASQAPRMLPLDSSELGASWWLLRHQGMDKRQDAADES